ncbi:MAG: GSCFA domain-containing protein [Bacteroidetes bacterium]|nr:GSCFA domain-containing protein [Bacteroidota bacterium]
MKSLQLRTEVSIKSPDWRINHQTGVLTLGSCFADVLGTQLEAYKFPVLSNPFGTVFNPYSMARLLTMVLENTQPNEDLYTQTTDGIWLHYDFHSSFWGGSREELRQQISEAMAEVKRFLDSSQVLVLTFGTAYVYRYRQNLALVSNCHKTPQTEFVKELLNPEQLLKLWTGLIPVLQRSRKLIVTVSPVRHTRDTLPLNQVSKSVLRYFCHRLSELFPNVTYFPSYEIMMDDLRDYRFYQEDLIHPNTLAEEYIFQVFAKTYLDKSTVDVMEEWDTIQKMMRHRPHHGYTASYRTLLHTIKTRLEILSESLPVQDELHEIEGRLRDFPS